MVLGPDGGVIKSIFSTYGCSWKLSHHSPPLVDFFGKVRGSEHRAKDIWSHPACKVGDKVVVLGKVGQA